EGPAGDEPGHALLRQVLALGVVEVGDLLGHGMEADPAGRLGAVPLPLEPVQVPLAPADEDESGDAGAGGHEHGDLAHGVPGADVWSRQQNIAYRAGRAIQAGRAWVNNYQPHPCAAGLDGAT